MKMRFMGNTGIKVSEICLGAMTFGGSCTRTGCSKVRSRTDRSWRENRKLRNSRSASQYCWTETYQNSELYEWMLKQRKAEQD
jgi:hypothetical protein